ncbi:MAG: glycoside hydrolase family 15 protein [Vicinamibacterales bacterium]
MPVDIPRLDHGVIGNGRVLALVSPTTRIDWLCLPHFDSPSVFARLLDSEDGGTFWFEATGNVRTQMRYVTNTNVLRTTVSADDGVFDVYDYAPRVPDGLSVDAPVEIHRVLLPREGEPHVRVRFDPRPDYARAVPTFTEVAHGLDISGGPQSLHLRTDIPAPYIRNNLPVRLDQPHYFILSCGSPPVLDSVSEVEQVMRLTIAGWRAWAKTCAIPSFAGTDVLRSALCLKLHAFDETGAIIAATTTSIPEAVGTERTWDYRFCWLRDAAFVVEALRRLSHLAEGEAFVRFLRDVAESGPLQPLYGIGGERHLVEERLDHLRGFAGTRPVRIGNAAYFQQQHDLMGEMVLCLESLITDPRVIPGDTTSAMALVERLVEQAIALYPLDDTGLWEFRARMRPYTFSKVLCWVAAHRGAILARVLGRPDLAERWDSWANIQRDVILDAAYNPTLGFFTQALHGEHPDASNLLLPTFGIIDARDPRFISTVRAYERLLVRNGLMLRYQHPDDFGDTTSAFTICSFWWAEAVAMTGEVDRAIDIFNRLLAYANPVGLFSEDIDPATGRLLGNFPQAYTHVGLIHTAITIGELLDARESRFRAWT